MTTIKILNETYDIKEETIFATQSQIADIFGVSQNTVSEHIKNIFTTEELIETETYRIFRNVSNQPIKHYSFDMIIAVGYRVNSVKATRFRIEATKILKEYLLQGRISQPFPTLLNIKPFKIRFGNDTILLAEIKDDNTQEYQIFFNINSICRNLKINSQTQRNRVKSDEILSKEVRTIRGTGNQPSLFIPIHYLDYFLDNIGVLRNINRKKVDKLITFYRNNCYNFLRQELYTNSSKIQNIEANSHLKLSLHKSEDQTPSLLNSRCNKKACPLHRVVSPTG